MSWIRKKESWVIRVKPVKFSTPRAWLEPLDPPTGIWTTKDLVDLVGDAFKVVSLKGKWEDQVLVYHPSSDGHVNELADNLLMESLGHRLGVLGEVLLTKACLIG